jgi:hypothetical protein
MQLGLRDAAQQQRDGVSESSWPSKAAAKIDLRDNPVYRGPPTGEGIHLVIQDARQWITSFPSS